MTAPEISLRDRVAVVTGAGRGLGRAHAELLARRGAAVVVNDLRGDGGEGSDPATEVVAGIVDAGGAAIANHDSVASREGGEALVRAALDTFGRVDIIVNNAGFVRDKVMHKLSIDEHVVPVVDVHLVGAFNVLVPAWPHLREQGYGRVVNTTSSSGLLGSFGQVSYAAAKMGIVGLTRTLAQEGASQGIRVNAVAPMAATRMTEAHLSVPSELLAPELVAPVVAYLASEDCSLNGEILTTAGGHVARVFIGFTQGIFAGSNLTPETVREQLSEICDEAGYYVPADQRGETAQVYPRLGVEGVSS